MFPNRNENQFVICITVTALVNIGLNIVLIPFFAHIGAIVATILSNTIGLAMQIIFSRKYFKMSLLFNKETLKYFIAGIIMLLILLLIPFNFTVQLINIIAGLCIGAFIYAILLIVLRSVFFLDMLRRAKKMIVSIL
jgi:O-antigen/teichoic acid export membrane protein